MSTRATIKITDGDDTIWIYHHSDGYPECVGKDLKKYLSTVNDNWVGEEIATILVKGKIVGKTYDIWKDKTVQGDDGYVITTCQHGDEEYAYHINCDDKTLTCYRIGFDEFEWNKIVVIDE